MSLGPFENAAALVEDWLDRGSGSTWAERDARMPLQQGRAWDIDLRDDALPLKAVRLYLPPDFPASACAFYVDRCHFLRVPHVEGDGKVCLGLQPIPNDYEDPVAAVARAIGALRDLLVASANDAQWVEEQFDKERASYWSQWCIARKKMPDHRPVATRTFVDLQDFDCWSAGAIAAYVPDGSKHRLYDLQVATAEGVDPHEVATQHRWATGMMVRGSALFVRMPADFVWTPSTWIRSFDELDALVLRFTEGKCRMADWLRGAGHLDRPAPHSRKQKKRVDREAPRGQRPLLVVLVQGGLMFGYQLFGSAIPALQRPTLEPVNIIRVDADWALARDHQMNVLRARRLKRVLLIGGGSLASPMAKAFARAGIGNLDIVDVQLMETENVSRHELGIDDAGQAKAPALARRLMQEVPGLTANGYLADARRWCLDNCKPGTYDLVVECTAESSVRAFMSRLRPELFGDCPIVHAWTEPLCSAGHVVFSQLAVPWPDDDPADALVNASDLSASDTRIQLPACSGGFHPYGAADIELVAAFAAERVIAVLDDGTQLSTVWSWVRSSAFFDALPVKAALRAIVPVSKSKADSATLTRDLAEVLRQA